MRAQRQRTKGQRFAESTIRAAGCAVVAGLIAPAAVQAADIIKANNTTTLTTSTSWVGGVVPAGSAATGGVVTANGDFGVWNNTVTAANTVSAGSGWTVGGIKIVDPGGLVTINGNAGATLTWGVLGIDMSAANIATIASGSILMCCLTNASSFSSLRAGEVSRPMFADSSR